ncbi:MAG: hypothetical protein ACTFAK_11850 [Candidatus Electronema sp. VV]
MCDDFLYHHNVLTHHFLFYHYPKYIRTNASGDVFQAGRNIFTG